MNLLGKLLCFALGKHKRGRLVEPALLLAGAAGKEHTYRCPRCGAQWSRKVRGKK